MENNFESLTLNEKKEKLKDILNEINLINKENVNNGLYEISNISYYKLENGKILYEVEVLKKDENGKYFKENELYESAIDVENINENKYKKINLNEYDTEINAINSNLENYKNLNYNTNDLEYQKKLLIDEKNEIEHLSSNKSKISLKDINDKENNIKYFAAYYGIPENKIEEYLEIQGDKDFSQINQLNEEAKNLGIKSNDISSYTKIDKNGKLSLDANKINFKGMQSGEISGNKNLTTFYTLNQILGKNYETYKIIKTSDMQSHVFGITRDGNIEEIDNNTIMIDNTKEMSLMDTDGSIKNVGIMISFSVRMPGSNHNGKQLIGMYNDNGNVGAFYARNDSKSKAIGEKIEDKTPHNVANNKEKTILDLRLNKDNSEAKSAVGADNINEISSDYITHTDFDSLVKEYSEKYNIDYNLLRNVSEEQLSLPHNGEHKTDEETIKEIAQNINEEKNKNDYYNENLKDNNNTNKNLDNEDIEKLPDDNLGTPWGKPNLH